ncbi:phage tail protein [Aquiflexum sp. TKW24L]|uniref:phage tail protein n=1 Tax=Aquiflexum sp. TKW24L TaxID=2942212 RepID=UPI0020BF538C|nr:phage tail protein [Aquiflexum sp. TKW24L]MCL6258083.1 phage tail protein [Aquiflexum sp. TKW24L]
MDTSSFFTQGYVPPIAFYFEIVFIGNGNSKMDSSFQEVSGLKETIETTEKKEGGDNVFVHQIPKSINYQDIVLKRCLSKSEDLEKWCRDTIENFEFKPMEIKLRLLSSKSEAVEGANIPIQLAAWSFEQAFPISWGLAAVGSGKNEFAIETLTLKYRKFIKTF